MKYPLEDHKPGEAEQVARFFGLVSLACEGARHGSCWGDAWDPVAHRQLACACLCHGVAA